MTELGLIKRFAEIDLECDWEIEGGKVALVGTETWLGANGEPYEKTVVWGYYNPLTDKALLWDLMVKYKVEVDYVNNYVSIHAKKGQRVTYTFVVDFKTNDDLPRAILECIVKAHK